MLFASRYQKSQVKQTVLVSLLILVIAAATVFALNGSFSGQLPTGSVVLEDGATSIDNIDASTSESGAAAEEPSTGNADSGEQADSPEEAINISIPADVISEGNETSSVGTDTGNASETPEEAINISVPPDAIPEGNETPPELTEPPAENLTANITAPAYNETVNITLPEEPAANVTANITQPTPEPPEANITQPVIPEINATEPELPEAPETNITEPENQTNITVITEPSIQLTIIPVPKITRGESFVLEATATNTGTGAAQNLVLNWILPEHFTTSDSTSSSCGTLQPSDFCTYSITINVLVSASLGENEVRVKASYG